VKDVRYLIRIKPKQAYKPGDQAVLLAQIRELTAPLRGKAINLRVTPFAVEFDLFIEPDAPLEPFKLTLEQMGAIITTKRIGLPPGVVDAQSIVSESRTLFNEHRFWEVHEVLEDLWKDRKGQEKDLLQGLILAAAALVHAQKNELAVVWPMLMDALKRLEDAPATYQGWDIQKFRDHFIRVVAQRKLEIPTV
jgi:hypothetical protein